MSSQSCRGCPLNFIIYRERKLGLKKEISNSTDIIIKGLVGIQFIYAKQNLLKELPENYRDLSKYFAIDVLKKDMPQKVYFSGKARLSFDGFLSDEDYKTVPEKELLAYEYIGQIYLVGIDYNEKEWIYGVAGDFNHSELPQIFNDVQVRISPLESSI